VWAQACSCEVDQPAIRLHDLRHGWATLALPAGIHPKVVQERLGHANISITLDTYSHVVGGLHEDAAEQVAALFRAGSNPVAAATIEARNHGVD
jgi:integrase